jgi:hypothetical protein
MHESILEGPQDPKFELEERSPASGEISDFAEWDLKSRGISDISEWYW